MGDVVAVKQLIQNVLYADETDVPIEPSVTSKAPNLRLDARYNKRCPAFSFRLRFWCQDATDELRMSTLLLSLDSKDHPVTRGHGCVCQIA